MPRDKTAQLAPGQSESNQSQPRSLRLPPGRLPKQLFSPQGAERFRGSTATAASQGPPRQGRSPPIVPVEIRMGCQPRLPYQQLPGPTAWRRKQGALGVIAARLSTSTSSRYKMMRRPPLQRCQTGIPSSTAAVIPCLLENSPLAVKDREDIQGSSECRCFTATWPRARSPSPSPVSL